MSTIRRSILSASSIILTCALAVAGCGSGSSDALVSRNGGETTTGSIGLGTAEPTSPTSVDTVPVAMETEPVTTPATDAPDEPGSSTEVTSIVSSVVANEPAVSSDEISIPDDELVYLDGKSRLTMLLPTGWEPPYEEALEWYVGRAPDEAWVVSLGWEWSKMDPYPGTTPDGINIGSDWGLSAIGPGPAGYLPDREVVENAEIVLEGSGLRFLLPRLPECPADRSAFEWSLGNTALLVFDGNDFIGDINIEPTPAPCGVEGEGLPVDRVVDALISLTICDVGGGIKTTCRERPTYDPAQIETLRAALLKTL